MELAEDEAGSVADGLAGELVLLASGAFAEDEAAGALVEEPAPIADWSALCCVEVVELVEFACPFCSTPAVWLLCATGWFDCELFGSLLVIVADWSAELG